jgi:hypothetical protein
VRSQAETANTCHLWPLASLAVHAFEPWGAPFTAVVVRSMPDWTMAGTWRPAHVVMDNLRTHQALGISRPLWRGLMRSRCADQP